jgi:pimeloyl-ACP methyl ester carboxylesterase
MTYNAYEHTNMQEHAIREGEQKLVYWTNRRKDKPTLIFIHGVSGSASGWRKCVLYFEKGYNVIVMDHRGHGFSSRPRRREEYAIHEFAEDVHKILREERKKKCVMIAHSFGTLIAIDFLHHHQDMIAGAILISTTQRPSSIRGAILLRPFIKAGLLINHLPQWKKTGEHVEYDRFVLTGDWNAHRTIVDMKNTGLRACLNSYETISSFDATDILPNISIPLLIIHGEKDTIFPLRYTQPIKKLLPNTTMRTMTGVDHIIVLNHHIELIKIMEDFLGRMKKQLSVP